MGNSFIISAWDLHFYIVQFFFLGENRQISLTFLGGSLVRLELKGEK
jgi:hypothetical protein